MRTAFAALESPQRAAQTVAEHRDRQRYRVAAAGDQLACDKIGDEVEITYAACQVSNPPEISGDYWRPMSR